jgi:hypothetical protein
LLAPARDLAVSAGEKPLSAIGRRPQQVLVSAVAARHDSATWQSERAKARTGAGNQRSLAHFDAGIKGGRIGDDGSRSPSRASTRRTGSSSVKISGPAI